MSRAPLLIFSPLPPARNGIADYCGELLPWHARDFDCTVVLDNAAPDPVVPAGVAVLRLAEYEAREHAFADVPHLYHVGNNPDHVYLLPVLMRRPGVVVLHDVSMHRLLECRTLRWGDVEGYCEALVREYGRPGQVLAGQARTMPQGGPAMLAELPMNRSVVARARAVVVHSEFARLKVQAQEPEARVVAIPHHVAPAALDAAEAGRVGRRAARERLGLDPDTLLFVSMGFVTREKQIDAVLRALARLRDEIPPFRYRIAGAALPGQYDVGADIARCGLEGIAELTGYVPDELFFTHVAAADVVLNLRYPVHGESSGTLVRAMGAGACVVVPDLGPFAELPDGTAAKVPWGPDADQSLLDTLRELAASPERRAALGRAAHEHVRAAHAIERSAAAYRDAILAARAAPAAPWTVDAPWEFATTAAHEAALAGLDERESGPGSLWWREAAVPLRGDGPVAVLACAAGDDCGPLLGAVYGHDAASVTRLPAASWTEALRTAPRRGAGLLLVALAAEDAGALWPGLVAANHALALGGVLVLDLWQGRPGAVPPALAQPEEVDSALLRAGFRLRRRWTGPEGQPSVAEACWQAVKISEFIDPPGRWTVKATPRARRAALAGSEA